MRRLILPLLTALLAATLLGQAAPPGELRFEAEACSAPTDAWVADKDVAGKWNLWSTDNDAQKKWSGGVVLRSPNITADRAAPEDGAAPLHVHVTGIPKGAYDISLKTGRVLGVSLDGLTWQPYRGGVLAAGQQIDGGTLDLWVDDRYVEKDSPGPCYFDCVILRPAVALKDGLVNPGYEAADGNAPSGWHWWSREGGGNATSVTDAKHSGERAVHIVHPGTKDWAFSPDVRRKARPGEELVVRGWVRCNDTAAVQLCVVAEGGGKLLTWDCGSAGSSGTHDWKEIAGEATVPAGADSIYVRWVGSGKADVWVDDISLQPGRIPLPTRPLVQSWAQTRVEERLDRGAVAVKAARGYHVSWRLLQSDPADVTFNVWRQAGNAAPEKANAAPVRWTTDYLDADAPDGADCKYQVATLIGGKEQQPAAVAQSSGLPYLKLKLDGNYTVQKCVPADLDGDGRLDWVVKQPGDNIDPYETYWQKSPDTYQIEAWTADGRLLWRNDLGWAIERGIWYSPFIAADLDGDGAAEVAAKVGDGDPRDAEGRVQIGAEWVVVWNGRTGKEIARAPWPDRQGLENYNLASRNQIAMAYLDGRTPCLISLRGTYTTMKAEAWELAEGKLRQLWAYNGNDFGGSWRGQGAHFTHCADIDGDGRDEVILGSAVIDDTGAPLWTTGRGHPDAAYLGDVDPRHPGLEISYVMETAQRAGGGLNQVGARDGKLLWALPEPTGHVHGNGMCTDIDPTSPGLEVYGQDSVDHKPNGQPWLLTSDGKLLTRDADFGFGVWSGYWDADLQRELLRGKLVDYQGGPVGGQIEGGAVLVADLLGDWREEIVTSVPGEVRIYSTPIPATDRRVCLLQDPIYRADVRMMSMGYAQVPMTTDCLEAVSPGLNLTAMADDKGEPVLRVVVSAPMATPVKGVLRLTADGATVVPDTLPVDVQDGERMIKTVALRQMGQGRQVVVRADLVGSERPLRGEVPVIMPSRPLTGVPMTQAESFSAQGGGEVHLRDDKPGVVGKCFSHWDNAGHWLEWSIAVPQAGRYGLAARYCAAGEAQRKLSVDGQERGVQSFPTTGGFGAAASEWDHFTAVDAQGKPLMLVLTTGNHVFRMENVDGKGLNLDYLALRGPN